jgi:hypothetical protein
MGAGSYTSVSSRAATADAAGRVQVTTAYATVLLDSDGKFVYVDIDSAQNQGTFDVLGAIVAAEAAPTKVEKGDGYGMKANSAIGKEWYEQINALEAYMIGKTLEEVLATPVAKKDDAHPAVPSGEDLKTSVSISIEGYLAAVEKAVANAVEVKGVASVGGGSISTVSGRAATAEKEGRIQTNVMFVGAAFDKDGKVLAAMLDTAQNQGTFDIAGLILKAEAAPTKVEKGDGYGMKAASAIGKEWYEQAKALTDYMVGKTMDEVKGIAITDEDLKTSVSVGIEEYIAAVEKAFANKVEIK